MKENVFKKKYTPWYYIKMIVLFFLISVIVTVAVSLLLGYKYKLVATGSMEPTIKTHSMVLDSPTVFEDLKVGDVITFTGASGSSTLTFTHRIIGFTEENSLITQGDNNANADRTHVTKDMYVGKVVFHNYFIGATVWYIKNNVLQVVIAVLVLFLEYVILT